MCTISDFRALNKRIVRKPYPIPKILLEAVFIKLQHAGLKVNATKLFFCTAETEYLGYILTRGGVKPQQKKVQAIFALNPPNCVKELQQVLGMVQYYQDMWEKHSEMLVPLTDLVGVCRETKTAIKIKIKSCLGGGILSINRCLAMLRLQSQRMQFWLIRTSRSPLRYIRMPPRCNWEP